MSITRRDFLSKIGMASIAALFAPSAPATVAKSQRLLTATKANEIIDSVNTAALQRVSPIVRRIEIHGIPYQRAGTIIKCDAKRIA